jgi:manganese/zinc/iron transport system permease protein
MSFTLAFVLFGAAILGALCGAVGTIAVSRRQALLGDTIAHAALPGVCSAFLIFGDRSFLTLFIGAVLSGALSVFCIWVIIRFTTLRQDAALGVTLSSFFGFGIVLSRVIQNQPNGAQAGLDTFIFGRAALMSESDVTGIAIIAALVLIVIVVFLKEIRLFCFDSQFMQALGYPVHAFEFFLLLLLCLSVTAGLPAVGVILVSALLIIPATTARFISRRFSTVLLTSICLGALGAVSGVLLSAYLPAFGDSRALGHPTGPLIVLSCFTYLLLVLLVNWARQYNWFFRQDRGPDE